MRRIAIPIIGIAVVAGVVALGVRGFGQHTPQPAAEPTTPQVAAAPEPTPGAPQASAPAPGAPVRRPSPAAKPSIPPAQPVARPRAAAPSETSAPQAPPARLLMLSAEGCAPCDMMKPVLEALGSEYAGTLRTEVIDITYDRVAADRYGVQYTPTLVFMDGKGTEIARRVGFTAKGKIVTVFAENGVTL